MKSRANHFLKAILMAFITTTLFVSCGKDNESGGSKKNPYNTYNYPGTSVSGNGQRLPSNWINRVTQENPCRTVGNYNQNSNRRTRVVIPLNGININAGSVHVGVTPEGDVAIASMRSNGPKLEVLLCPRPDLTGNGSLMSNPTLRTSQSCPVGEITAATISLNSNSGFGNYTLMFAPIHIPGTDRYSSLCNNGGGGYSPYGPGQPIF